MAKIYLTGAVSDWDDPFKWHDDLKNSFKWRDHEFVNPYTLNDFELGDQRIYQEPEKVVEPALEAIEECDGMLVRWDDSAFLVGTAMEMKHAYDHGIPIVVWYDGFKDNLSPWILHTTKGRFDTLDKAIRVLLIKLGDMDGIHK